MSIKTITDNIKNGKFLTLYYIFGEEEYLKEYYYDEIRKKCVIDFVDFNVFEFDSKNFDYLDFTNCVNSYPVMADRKFVGVTDFDNSLLKKDFTKGFIDFLKGIPEYCTVVFFDSELKTSTSDALEKAIIAAGGVVAEVKHPSSSSLINWLQRHFKTNGKVISNDDLNYMISITDTDMRTLLNEVSKLCSFVSGEVIGRDDIDRVVTKSIEANRFEIGDAFCSSDYNKILDILDKLYKQNIDELIIANVFYRAFSDMWKAKIALISGKTAFDLANDFSFNKYVAGKIMKNVQNMDISFLEEAVELSKKLDLKFKGYSYGNKRDNIMAYIADVVRRREIAKTKNR